MKITMIVATISCLSIKNSVVMTINKNTNYNLGEMSEAEKISCLL